MSGDLITEITIFVLAVFVGFEVISKVPTMLHTPLMSGTNAIHGIVLLGGLIVVGAEDADTLAKIAGTVAVAFGTINIVGGFLVTDRMLEMFKGRKKRPSIRKRIDGWVQGRQGLTLASFVRDIDFINSAYLVASVLFILGIRGLSHPRTARQGNIIASIGMFIAVVATLLHPDVENYGLIAVGVAIGSVIGVVSARAVKMTAMPQMVALFNGVGGGAVALVALSEYHELIPDPGEIPLETLLPTLLSCVIGAVSFSGSLIAFAKLQELMTGRPIVFPGNQFINGGLLLGIVFLIVYLATGKESEGLFVLMLCGALVFGVLLIIPVGGADMPVVISMLNAFTGLSAAGAGFVLDNNALIVAGSLVGSSGTLLTILMGRAMNRSLSNVLFSAFGSAVAGGPSRRRPTIAP